MSSQPLFSVVIPTYNRESFILETLETVFSQTYERFEIIVVDNASTDSTVDLLRPLDEAGKIRLILHPENFERAVSRNTGIANANGDYLTFLDSDDFMFPTCLEDAAMFADSHPEIKVFHNLNCLVDGSKKAIYHYSFPSLRNRIAAIANGNFMSCIGDFLHRDVYTRYSFDIDPSLTGGEDWDFWLRVLADFEVGRIENINSGIRHHEGRSVNNQNIDSMERGLQYLVAKFRSDPHLSTVYERYLNRIEAGCQLYLNLLSNDARDSRRAFGYLANCAKADPYVILSGRFARSFRRTALCAARSLLKHAD